MSSANRPTSSANTDGFLAGWQFPTLLLSILVSWPALLLSVLLVPPGDGPMAAFADQFKVWCFGYDPATGAMQWVYVVLLVVNPMILVGLVSGVWWKPLRWAWQEARGGMARWGTLGAALAVALGAGLTLMSEDDSALFDGPLAFPAEELRTKHIPPAFDLVDQHGVRVSSDGLEGQVTLLTAVYASCPHTCPLILTEARAAMDALPPELADKVRVVAITMDPANDGQEQMAALASMHGLTSPRYRMLSGDAAVVEPLLDDLGVARTRDEATGVISHANLFILVDVHGRIAYRLALGPQQESWLPTALQVLAREERGATPTG